MQMIQRLSAVQRAVLVIFLVTVAVQAAVLAASDPAYRESLEAAYAADEPGAAAIVARGDEVLYLDARGAADLEHGIAIEPGMVFRLGSITKQFSAAAVMMLAEQGKLSLDDPLTKFLPDYPEVGQKVTVEHLLTHTSGIVSYTGIPGYMQSEVTKELTVDELVAVFKDLPVEFAPGERFAYNNSGYVLLGAVIEKASGMSYEKFIQENIFDPLGMSRSYYGSHSRIIPGRVSGYGGAAGEYQNARYLSMSQPYAAGSLLSTVEDLLRWNTALFGGKVVSEASLERMITPYTLSDGESTGYGFGLAVRDIRGRHAIAHGGGIFGFSTNALYIPEEKIFVAVLSNSTGSRSNPTTISTRLAAVALGDPIQVSKEVAVDPAILASYAGEYELAPGFSITIRHDGARLFARATNQGENEIFAASDTEFFLKVVDAQITFVPGEDGSAPSLVLHQGGRDAPGERKD